MPVETAFTDRMKEQVNLLLTAITNTQSQHSTDLTNLQKRTQPIRTLSRTSGKGWRNCNHSLSPQEPTPPPQRAGSQPLLWEGGPMIRMQPPQCTWPRTHQQLQLDIDMQDAFVPGPRRGYLVIPYKPKDNESEPTMISRLTQAIQQVRQASQPTGSRDTKWATQTLVVRLFTNTRKTTQNTFSRQRQACTS